MHQINNKLEVPKLTNDFRRDGQPRPEDGEIHHKDDGRTVVNVNATTLYALSICKRPKDLDSFKMGWEMAMSLVRPFVAARSLNGLSSAILGKINHILGIVRVAPAPGGYSSSGERRRCALCLKENRGEGAKKRKNIQGKTKTQCQVCARAVCEYHYHVSCTDHCK